MSAQQPKLSEAIKPGVKRLSLCELAITLSPLFSLEALIVADDESQPTDSSKPLLPDIWAIVKKKQK